MPYVNIVYGRGSYREQKVERSMRIPSEILDKNPAITEVIGARSSRERVTQADRRARR